LSVASSSGGGAPWLKAVAHLPITYRLEDAACAVGRRRRGGLWRETLVLLLAGVGLLAWRCSAGRHRAAHRRWRNINF
jgi:hypothetical protein